MPTKKSTNADFLPRILRLVSKTGLNEKNFALKSGLNHSFFTTLKARPNGFPSGQSISAIVDFTGCNGHWLITGEGEMYITRENIGHDEVAEPNISQLLSEAEQLFSYLEDEIDADEVFELDPDLRVQLQKLLLKDAESRRKR